MIDDLCIYRPLLRGGRLDADIPPMIFWSFSAKNLGLRKLLLNLIGGKPRAHSAKTTKY